MSSSMPKVHREFVLSYLIQVSLLLILYFLAVPDTPYRPETIGLTYAFSLWKQVGPTVTPVACILFGLYSLLSLSALASLAGRTIQRRDVLLHVLTAAVHLLFFLGTTLALFLVLRPIATHFKMTGVTEIPFVASYLVWTLLVALAWKFFTYAKLLTRIRYFRTKEPTSVFRILLSGFRGPHRMTGYLMFVALLAGICSVPVALMISGAILQQPILLGGALMAATLAYSYGNFYLIAHFWDRETILTPAKKEEATPPPKKKKK